MCGIVGFVNLKQNINTEKYQHVLSDMSQSITHRGPDEHNSYYDEHALLAHRRLIVVDPEGGKQPMLLQYHENNYCLTYNGQIYNTKELREELERNGFTFSTHSDVEVLLKSYAFWGYDVVSHLNGIFAFAIWNSSKQELFVARDHFGIKPFYYTIFDDTFIFASEVKSLFQYPGIEVKIGKEGICELFGLGPAHTAGNGIFKDIYELPPAHFAIWNKDGLHKKRYWHLQSKHHTDSLCIIF